MAPDGAKLKALKAWGLPRSPSPVANTLALMEVDAEAGERPKPKFSIYDFVKDARVAELPIHERNTKLDDYCPQWTADGRYLYYVDVEMEQAADGRRGRPKSFTRVWDVKQNKEVAKLPDFFAIGPCGGSTSMVLAKPRRGGGGMFLHDATTGSDASLAAGVELLPLSTTGKYVIYARKSGEGEMTVCRAEIKAGSK